MDKHMFQKKDGDEVVTNNAFYGYVYARNISGYVLL